MRPASSPRPRGRRSERSGLTEDEIEEFRDAFNFFDTDGTGMIDLKELRAAMQSMGFETKKPTVYQMISDMEKKWPGPIDLEEFLDEITSKLGDWESREGMQKIFALFTDDHTSTITFKSLKRVAKQAGEALTDEELREMIERADTNGDGEISFEDFYSVMTRKSFS